MAYTCKNATQGDRHDMRGCQMEIVNEMLMQHQEIRTDKTQTDVDDMKQRKKSLLKWFSNCSGKSSNAKKSKKLLDLPDDCLLVILSFLNRRDLPAFASTCVCLQSNARRVFKRFPNYQHFNVLQFFQSYLKNGHIEKDQFSLIVADISNFFENFGYLIQKAFMHYSVFRTFSITECKFLIIPIILRIVKYFDRNLIVFELKCPLSNVRFNNIRVDYCKITKLSHSLDKYELTYRGENIDTFSKMYRNCHEIDKNDLDVYYRKLKSCDYKWTDDSEVVLCDRFHLNCGRFVPNDFDVIFQLFFIIFMFVLLLLEFLFIIP